jgi:hypothetical protein
MIAPTLSFPEPSEESFPASCGLQFMDVAPMICGVVDNGVCSDDPRVMVRLNEATKIILDNMIPVGGMAVANIVPVVFERNSFIILPPQMENAITAHPVEGTTKVRGSNDIAQGWSEIVNNSAYIDPEQQHDNPLIDQGLNGSDTDRSDVRRVYIYPGLEPPDAVVQVTGAKRFLPVTSDDDYPIVQNVEAVKCIILSIERYENNAVDEATKYRQAGLDLLQAEVKKHLLDPRNYMYRKAAYLADIVAFPQSTLGWTRAQIALDLPEALRYGKRDLTWAINQCERRIMERGMFKDTVISITANVVGGTIYFPASVEAVLAFNLNGQPIPIRSQFFQYLDNGPGGSPCSSMLIDQGDVKQPGFASPRRKYKLVAPCTDGSCISAVCKLRWVMKEPGDMMVIKNYEAIRLMMTAKFLEEKQDWQNAQQNQQNAFDIMDRELRNFLGGIRHTVHIQTYGFGLGDVGNRNL